MLCVPLLAAIGWATWSSRGHSAQSVDARTFIEMIRGIADHGVPYLQNGPVGEYPELRARWNAEHNGKLWGTYPPLFPYLAAPFFKVGGLVAVSRVNTALLLVLVAGVFLLARRMTGDPLAGTAAVYLCVLSTPLLATAHDTNPFTLATTLMTWTVYFALRSVEAEEPGGGRPRPGLWAAACGFVGGLACAAHVVNVAMLGAILLALFLLPGGGGSAGAPVEGPIAWLRSAAASRASRRRGAIALAAAAVALAPVAALNVLRFGTPNIATYGPEVWRSSAETGLDGQTLGAMAGNAFPVGVWLLVSAALLWGGRKTWLRRATALGASLLLFWVWEPVRRYGWAMGKLLFTFIVDCSGLQDAPSGRPPDGLGALFGPFVIRSLLQEAPVVLLAILAPVVVRRDRVRTILLALPVAALFATLSMRANLPTVYAIGYPFLHLRYLFAAMPLLVVLAVASLRPLPWRPWHVPAVLAGAVLAGLWLARYPDDMAYARRLVILRGTLVVAAAATLATWFAHRRNGAWRALAVGSVAAACALGLAINTAIDLREVRAGIARADARLDRVAARTPQRFALIGWAREIDTPLALRASRDIEYADMYESKEPLHSPHIHALLHHWTAAARPIFALLPTHVKWDVSPWPDYDLVLVDPATNLFAVRPKP